MGQFANALHVFGVAALVPAYVMLLALGSELAAARAPGQDGAGPGVIALAVVDVAVVYGVAVTSRLRRGQLYVLLVGVFYGMKALGTGLHPGWLPLALVLPALVLTLMGRRAEVANPWGVPGRAPTERLLEVLLLGAVAYPLLSHAVDAASRAGSGAGHLPTASGLAEDMLRGLLQIGLALPVLRTTQGPWWLGGCWVALLFSLVQVDLHWVAAAWAPDDPHPVGTAVTGLVFGCAVAWLVQRPSAPAILAPPQPRPT